MGHCYHRPHTHQPQGHLRECLTLEIVCPECRAGLTLQGQKRPRLARVQVETTQALLPSELNPLAISLLLCLVQDELALGGPTAAPSLREGALGPAIPEALQNRPGPAAPLSSQSPGWVVGVDGHPLSPAS